MQKQISKKIIVYLFILLLLGTLNNKNFLQTDFKDSSGFEISSLSEFDDTIIVNDILDYKHENLFFLKKEKIKAIIEKYNLIEDYNIYKRYPSKMIVNLKKTKLLAATQVEGDYFYIGSNGKFIKTKDIKIDLPIIFGKVDLKEFLNLKNLIDDSFLDFSDIKSLYYFKSKRWDIETKNGLLIRLPVDDLIKSFKILGDIINNNEFKNIQMIDLRQNNQVIING